jgi:hypothetical protein
MSIFVFEDHKKFMEACGQTTTQLNPEQVRLYALLIDEETNAELLPAIAQLWSAPVLDAETVVEAVDAALDTIVVCIGLLYSLGVKPQPLWNEVKRSNMAKIDPATGRVLKREDGKVLKPAGWTPPALLRLITEQYSETEG